MAIATVNCADDHKPSTTTLLAIADIHALGSAAAPFMRFLNHGEEDGGALSFAEVVRRARSMAGWLRRIALPGERALLAYPAGLDFPVAFLACLYAEVIAVPVDVSKRKTDSERLQGIAHNCTASLFLASSSLRDRLPDVGGAWLFTDELDCADTPAPLRPIDPDSIAYIQYSSGTTRAPRGSAISHRALVEQLEYYRLRGGPGWDELVLIGWLPHSHDFGLVGFILSALYMGRPLVAMAPSAFLRRPARWIEAIDRYRGSYCGGPAFGYEMCAAAAATARADVDLSCWRIASLGGDHVFPNTLEQFEAAFAPMGFRGSAWLPAYGLAESVLCATGRQGAVVRGFSSGTLRQNLAMPSVFEQNATRLVSCGVPMPGQELRIVDPDTRANLSSGRIGEIWLRGASLASGYWNDPAATAEQFEASLSGDTSGRHWLRTGDRGFLCDGELFVTGRLKDLIVVRGENHAPDDVERTVQAVDATLRRGAGAVVQADVADGARLVLVQEVERKGNLDSEALFAAIDRAVSERHGLLLDAIVLIRAGTLPRSRTGKISRAACSVAFEAGTLPIIAQSTRRPADACTPPRGSSECVADAVLDELSRLCPDDLVSPTSNLFDLGFDSLRLVAMVGWVREQFGVELPLRSFFEQPTVAELVATIEGAMARGERAESAESATISQEVASLTVERLTAEVQALKTIGAEQGRPLATLVEHGVQILPAVELPRQCGLLLSDTQREMLLLADIRDNAAALFNIQMVLEFIAVPDADIVERALARLAERHEAFRTIFVDGQQHVLANAQPSFADDIVEDIALVDWLRAERLRPFAIDEAPPWRVVLVRTQTAQLLVLTVHHATMDGASLPLFVGEFVAFYEDEAVSLPPPQQFRDHLHEQARRREASGRVAFKDWWQARLGSDLPDWKMPCDPAPAREKSYAAASHRLTIDGALRVALVGRGGAAGATLFQIVLAAYAALLHRVSAQERIVIGVDTANRDSAADAGIIGCCTMMVPLVLNFAEVGSVDRWLAEVREKLMASVERRDYTLADWAQDRRIAPDMTRPFKFAATINMQRFPMAAGPLVPRFDLEAASVGQNPFALSLDIRDTGDGLLLDLIHNRQLFDVATVERLGGYLRRLLETIAIDGTADVLAVPMLGAAEVIQLRHWGKAKAPAPSFRSFGDRFAAQALATPDALTVDCSGRSMTYGELDRASDAMADMIVRGTPAGAMVGVLASRGSGWLAATIGAFKAGRVYVPLDPKAPDVRLAGQVAQVGIAVVLHDADHAVRAAALGKGVSIEATLAIESERGFADVALAANTPAYVLFTSGSTGAPKAAVVGHGGMANHLLSKIDILALTAADRVAQTASQTFDISIWQALSPLIVGASVTIFDDSITHDPEALFAACEARGITVLQTVPSMLSAAYEGLVAPGGRLPLARMRWLISTGEALPVDLARRWIGLYPRIPLLNAYGPTECSDDVTHHVLEWPPLPHVMRVPIGRPIAGAELYVLDAHGNLAPAGTPGELHVGGPCIGLGYHGDAERTAAAFVPNPFSDDPAARLYRTGDLVRFDRTGVLEFLGRVDQQVKVNGVRIEPGEIVRAISHDPSVLMCHVEVRQRVDGSAALVAYVALRPGTQVDEGTLKAVARNTLPAALVPAAIVILEAMPLTANGKIDVAALPPPDLSPCRSAPVAPSTPTETRLAEIWAESIGDVQFGVEDDFFALGGRSLDAATILRRVEAEFGVKLPLSQIFREPTVASIARRIDDRRAAAGP